MRATNYSPAFRLAKQAFGVAKGKQVAAYLVRLASNQSISWSWLRMAVKDGLDLGDLALDGVAQVILLHDQRGGDPVDSIIDAWAVTMAEAGAGRHHKHHGMKIGRPEVSYDRDRLVEFDEEVWPSGAGSEFVLDWSTIPDQHRTVLFARAEGLEWHEVARVAGYKVQTDPRGYPSAATPARAFRTAVRHLIDANPDLIERFGLTPCPNGQHSRCRTCKSYGYLYNDGSTL